MRIMVGARCRNAFRASATPNKASHHLREDNDGLKELPHRLTDRAPYNVSKTLTHPVPPIPVSRALSNLFAFTSHLMSRMVGRELFLQSESPRLVDY